MYTNDEIGKRIMRIEANRIIDAAKSTKCARCVFVGIPRGAKNSACCDTSSENYHRKIGDIPSCRRWKR